MPRAQLYAELYGLLQRQDLARAYYDSARSVVSRNLQKQPDDARFWESPMPASAGR
ncbi:MAG: hypothetical protein ACREMM_06935 [Gemmatimonadales bacterium]